MLELQEIHKHFETVKAVNNVSLSLAEGEVISLLGPSGCGKSTLLRLIAGLESPTKGKLLLEAQDITRLSPQKRGFGMVFQDYALFPHLNVAKNISYGLVEKGWSKTEQQARIGELLELVNLSGYETRRMHQLSGGEQQRIALARALAPKPKLLLLDEPLSNLDMALRDSLGQIEQLEEAKSLYANPKSQWLADFFGHDNLYEVTDVLNTISHSQSHTSQNNNRFLLLRSDLCVLKQVQDSPQDFKAQIISQKLISDSHHLELFVEALNITIQWQGFEREVSHLDLNQDIFINIPPSAWIELGQ